jgi:hypothetical protein
VKKKLEETRIEKDRIKKRGKEIVSYSWVVIFLGFDIFMEGYPMVGYRRNPRP